LLVPDLSTCIINMSRSRSIIHCVASVSVYLVPLNSSMGWRNITPQYTYVRLVSYWYCTVHIFSKTAVP
jgi:hypothetical protein